MRIEVAKSAGFCFGVRRALRIAAETAARGGDLSMLGEIVHNEDVLRDIERAGLRRVARLSRGRSEGVRTLLISAHGVSRRTLERALALGYRVVDATCPMVKQIHRTAARAERHGRRVVIIGDRNHDEVRGIVGQLRGRCAVISDVGQAAASAVCGRRPVAVVVQSTQDGRKVERIVGALRRHRPDLEFHDTICRPTRHKQKEVQDIAARSDAVVVIGSRTSANTRRLYEIAREVNRRTHWVRSAADVRPAWFRGARRVGVSAGASTPESVTRAVVERLGRIVP